MYAIKDVLRFHVHRCSNTHLIVILFYLVFLTPADIQHLVYPTQFMRNRCCLINNGSLHCVYITTLPTVLSILFPKKHTQYPKKWTSKKGLLSFSFLLVLNNFRIPVYDLASLLVPRKRQRLLDVYLPHVWMCVCEHYTMYCTHVGYACTGMLCIAICMFGLVLHSQTFTVFL